MADGSAPLMLSVSGMRGIVGSSMTPEVAARFGGVFGGWLRERRAGGGHGGDGRARVILARDGRAGGEATHHAAMSGLLASGADVIDLDVATTPTVGVMVDATGADGGLMVTASHNPQQWNGLKPIVRDAAGAVAGGASASAPAPALADELIARYHDGRVGLVSWDMVGRGTDGASDAIETHVTRVTGALGGVVDLDRIRSLGVHVALDSVCGSGGAFGERLLRDLSARVTRVDTGEAGVFPHTPEPTAENLVGLCDAVRASGAAVGFAQDPDADRLAIVDETGRYIGEEYTLALAARALFECGAFEGGRGGGLCTNLSTSRMIEDVGGAHGVLVERTPVGEANVVAAMKRSGSLLGGEGNGGVIWSPVTYIRDSLGAMGLVLALLAQTGRSLSELVGQVPSYAIEKRKVELADRSLADRAGERIAAHWSGHRVDRQDGVRVDFEGTGGGGGGGGSWIHVRASNTEPIMRLIAEAPDRSGAVAILDEAAGVIG